MAHNCLQRGSTYTSWQLDHVSGARSCLAKGVSAACPWTLSIPAAWLMWGEVGQADVTPPPRLSLLEGPNQRQTVFAKSHGCQCGLEMLYGRRVDLMALVLPSSTELSQSQSLGLFHLALTVPCPLQAVTPFTQWYRRSGLATTLFLVLHGAEHLVLGPFCRPHFPFTLLPEPVAHGYAAPWSCTPWAAEATQQGKGVLS